MGIQRTFIDISEDIAFSQEQSQMVRLMGFKGAISWDQLLKSRRVIIISESGSGKTFECKSRQRELFESGAPSFFFDLGSLSESRLRELMPPAEEARFDQWLKSQSATATFFLDSIDELKLARGSMEKALIRICKELEGNLQRATFVITTRPVPFDVKVIQNHLNFVEVEEYAPSAEKFAEVAMGRVKDSKTGSKDKDTPPIWRMVSITPLSDSQIIELAQENGVANPTELLNDIKRRNAEAFAQRPQDLIELCTDWRDFRRIRSHRDQLDHNVMVKLLPRTDRGERAQLSPEKAYDGASRLALAALLTRRLTIRHSPESNSSVHGHAALDPRRILPNFSEDEIATLLERALFGFASYGRVRFHHQSVIEYLAASRLQTLSEKGLPSRALCRLLLAEAYEGRRVVKPTMRPVVAWLASRVPTVYEEALSREPEVLLDHGDPESLTASQRHQALSTYAERYGSGSWRGLRVPPIQVHRLSSSETSSHAVKLLAKGIENVEVRELLVELLATAPSADSADAAFSIAKNSEASPKERGDANTTLAKLNDPRLSTIVRDLKDPGSDWTIHQRKWALFALFPLYISPEDLCEVLALVRESKRSVGDLGWMLARSVLNEDIQIDYVARLRSGLTSLALDGSKWSEQKGRLQTPKPHVIEPLAATCAQLLKAGRHDSEVIHSSVAAIKLAKNDSYLKTSVEELKLQLSRLEGEARAAAFWASDAIYLEYHPDSKSGWRWIEATQYGPFIPSAEKDLAWIMRALSSKALSVSDRSLALEAALRVAPHEMGARLTYLENLKPLINDSPDLLNTVLRMLSPPEENPEITRMEEENRQHQEKAKQKEEFERAAWMNFWEDVSLRPEEAFSDEHSEATAWNLWTAMRHSADPNKSTAWDRAFIERHFNHETAEAMRIVLRSIWRRTCPTLRSERAEQYKNTYLVKWQLGLSAIAAEAEDSNWATHLSRDEAKLAARYAPIELNGFPFWLTSLVEAHKSAVDEVLGSELISELSEPALPGWHSSILQSLSQASSTVAKALLPRLNTWILSAPAAVEAGQDAEVLASRFRRVIELLLKYGDEATRSHLLITAKQKLEGGLDSPLAPAWLPTLIKLDPDAGIRLLELSFSSVTPSPSSVAVTCLGRLFGDRHDPLSLNPRDPQFTPSQLLSLVWLSYKHVRHEDDLQREGAYSPGIRDHAEHARSAILSALLESRGIDAWHAKLELSRSPLLTHFRDRAERHAIDIAAQEADFAKMSEDDVSILDRYMDAPALTRDDVFSLLCDRLNDLEDLLKSDGSPLSLWRLVDDEKMMRRAISRELSGLSRGLYTVEQESVTADEKETDIRLRSSSSEQEGVIELKIGDKDRSARSLRDSIEGQLVRKYLAPESRRAGVFLVTFSGKRSGWQHPETNADLDCKGLEALLQEEAARLMHETSNAVRITARVLDLRPRLPTER